MTDKITELMNKITKWENPSIYSISVEKRDYRTGFTAHATTRGEDSKSYSASGNSVLDALQEMEKLLSSLVCPTCGRMNRHD